MTDWSETILLPFCFDELVSQHAFSDFPNSGKYKLTFDAENFMTITTTEITTPSDPALMTTTNYIPRRNNYPSNHMMGDQHLKFCFEHLIQRSEIQF